jgi:hypothetical protein
MVVALKKIFYNIMNNQKTYKIIIGSKKIRNIRGKNSSEVAKKVASKLLINNIYSIYFSLVLIKTNKIVHYYAMRPYNKNGKLVKYKIIVKKIKNQIGGIYEPNIDDPKDPIYIFFNPIKYNISTEETENFGKFINIKDRNLDERNDRNCLKIIFNQSSNSENIIIELFKLDRCNFTGTDNLITLIKYITYLKNTLNIKIDYIFLEDASYIPGTNIMLWLLSILKTGQSWYNRFGFVSESFEEEQKANNDIIKKNIIDFIDESISVCNKVRKKHNFNKSIHQLEYQQIRDFFGRYNKTKTVQEIFNQISIQLLERQLSREEITIIENLFHIIYLSNIINYNPFLTYKIR